MMKTKRFSLVTAVLMSCLIGGCSQADSQAKEEQGQESSETVQTEQASAIDLIADIATTQYFTDEAVSEDDIETILTAGINAPSAMNGQPWHFSVITDAALLQQISEDMSAGMGPGRGMPPAGAELPEGAEPPEGLEPPEGAELPEGAEPPEGAELAEGAEPPEGLEPPQGTDESGADTIPAPPENPGENGAAAGGTAKAGIADAPLVIAVSCVPGSALDAGLACQNMSVAAQLLGYGTKIISSPTIAVNGEKQEKYRELLGIPEEQTAVAFLLVGVEDLSAEETVDAYAGATARNPLDEMVTYVEEQ